MPKVEWSGETAWRHSPPTVVRTYQADDLASATALLQRDLPHAGAAGYVVVGQTWQNGSSVGSALVMSGGVLFLLGLFLFLGLIAVAVVLVLIGLVVGNKYGSLLVTFQQR